MTKLAIAACALGAVKLGSTLGALYAPDQARRMLRAFPRHEASGWFLIALDLLWTGWLVLHTIPFSSVPRIEMIVYIGTPVLFFAIVLYMEELLSVRALGGFLMLLANPVLAAGRMHESPWSVVLSLLAYAWVVLGMAFMVSPFLFRRMVEPILRDRVVFRAVNLAGLAGGAVLLFLGIAVY